MQNFLTNLFLHSVQTQTTGQNVAKHKQYNLVSAKDGDAVAGQVTAGLVESNGSVSPGLWLSYLRH